MSDSIRHKLSAVLEASYGVTPTASPAFIAVRHTECDLDLTKTAANSAEITGDGQLRNSRHGPRSVAGGYSLELTYGEPFDTFIQALLGGTWTGDVLKVGLTRRSFSLLRHFQDQTVKPYHLYKGVEVNTLDLSIPAEGVVTGSFGLIGQDRELLANLSTFTTPTFADPTVLNAFDGFTGTITEGGSAIAILTALEINYNRGLAPRMTVASGGKTIRPSEGQKLLTGTATAFFESTALLEKFVNETESSIGWTLVDPHGNEYEFEIPRLKYNGGPIPTTGSGPITIALPFQALYDEDDDTVLTVTRTNAA